MKKFLVLFAALLFVVAACDKQEYNPDNGGFGSLDFRSQVSGAIFTTNDDCDGTNVNLFGSKQDVYLDGGPRKLGSAGLPDGNYYVKVTTPDGDLLGYTPTASVVVSGGEFAVCYQLWAILVYPDGTTQGYETTDNNGGVYKVWASIDGNFPNNTSKTDNFKVDENDPEPDIFNLNVIKFYDANTDGIQNNGEVEITGWLVNIQNGINIDRSTPVNVQVGAGDYTVSEYFPSENNWVATTPTSVAVSIPPSQSVAFGNVCLGAGGGSTLGFWSNRNGGRIITDRGLLPGVLALCLRRANGTLLGTVSLSNFQRFLLDATATNMANMLSAQLAAMHLNVASGNVNGNALIYAPGTNAANAAGFATVNAVMAEANALLCAKGSIPSGDPDRARAEALKNALDNGNNNLNFVQAAPCAYTFGE